MFLNILMYIYMIIEVYFKFNKKGVWKHLIHPNESLLKAYYKISWWEGPSILKNF